MARFEFHPPGKPEPCNWFGIEDWCLDLDANDLEGSSRKIANEYCPGAVPVTQEMRDAWVARIKAADLD
jgi:hypothetical protein